MSSRSYDVTPTRGGRAGVRHAGEKPPSRSVAPSGLLALQRAAGNQAVIQMLATDRSSSVRRNGSTTEAHEASKSGKSIKDTHPETARPWFGKASPERQVIDQIEAAEQKWSGSHFVFYNAAGPCSHALHRLIAAIEQQLASPELLWEVQQCDVLLRAPGTPFLTSIPEIIDLMSRRGKSDHQAKASLLSANLSLFANTGSNGTEGSYAIWKAGGLAEVTDELAGSIIGGHLDHHRFPAKWGAPIVNETRRLIDLIAKRQRGYGDKSGGALYQILVPKGLAAELAYISTVNGLPLGQSIAPQVISNDKVCAAIRSDNFDVRDRGFTFEVLERARTPEFWDAFDAAKPQARLLMAPEYFSTFNNTIHIETYSKISADIEQEITIARDKIIAYLKEYADQFARLRREREAERQRLIPAILDYAARHQNTLAEIPTDFSQSSQNAQHELLQQQDDASLRHLLDDLQELVRYINSGGR